jgi:hypothetical protein
MTNRPDQRRSDILKVGTAQVNHPGCDHLGAYLKNRLAEEHGLEGNDESIAAPPNSIDNPLAW